MQTSFMMPMVHDAAAMEMFSSWTPMPGQSGLCWELKTIQLCEQHLTFEQSQWGSKWGVGNALPSQGYSDQTSSTVLAACCSALYLPSGFGRRDRRV